MKDVSSLNSFPSLFIGSRTGRNIRRLSVAALLSLAVLGSPLALGATFQVTEATDAALRAAVTEANQTSGPDVIEFAPGITAITLTEGQVEITEDLVIAGPPDQPVTISGDNASRVFAARASGEVFPILFLQHLIIENGLTTEPGSSFTETPLINCSTATGQGGAICSEGSVQLFETIVRNSTTQGRGAHGGGIWAADEVLLEFSSVYGNTVGGQAIDGDDANGAGVSTANDNGTVICFDSRIADNRSSDENSQGGGVLAGAFFADNCIVSGNQAGTGGGVFASYINISASTVRDNVANGNGGGVLASASFISFIGESQGALKIVNSTISGNSALGSGGGIRWIAPDTRVDIDGDESPDALISNSTITNNLASFGAGGVDIVDPFFVSPATFSLSRLQMLKDRSEGQSKPQPPRLNADGTFAPEITSTILSANSTAGESDPDLVITEGQRSVTLVDQNNFIGFGDLLDIEVLRDNGCFEPAGATVDPSIGCALTHRPLTGSSVIDEGLNPLQLTSDQRGIGFAREVGLAADIGALETAPLAIEALGLEVPTVRQGELIFIFWRATPNVAAVECTGAGLAGTTWDGPGKPADGFADVDSTPLAPGEYLIALSCALDGETVAAETSLTVLEPVVASLTLEGTSVALGGIASLSWAAFPDDSGTVCTATSTPAIDQWTGPVANSGVLDLDTGLILPGTYALDLLCQRGEFSASDTVELTVTDDPLDLTLLLSQEQAITGDLVQIEWSVIPDDEFSSCTGTGLPGTQWDGLLANAGLFELDTSTLPAGTYTIGLSCSRPGQEASASAVLTVEPLTLLFEPLPATLVRGEILTISWSGSEGLICSGSGLEGTTWPGEGKPGTGSEAVETAVLEPGDYLVGLQCEREGVTISAQRTFTLQPLVLNLDASPTALLRGDDLTISWNGTEGLLCTGTGLAGSSWPGAGKPASGSEIVATSGLAAGDYTIGLLCEGEGLTVEAETSVTVLPLQLTLEATPASLRRGDDLTISWTGTEGLLCTGSGLAGTAWPGAGKPASGSETIATAPLAAGDYVVGLLCERNGVTVEAEAPVTVLPLQLTLDATPTPLIRGDDLTISWTGTEGLLCTGSGLAGTSWPGAGKPASGTETIATAPLAAGDYTIGLSCEREGLTLEAEASVTVLPLQLTLEATPTPLIRGDDLTINWIGTEGLLCTGTGLAGTAWPGEGKPASGSETIATAPLAAGDYTVGLLCERAGLTVEAEASVQVLPLQLTLGATPTPLIRGDDLTISWTGTEGLLCTGSGLAGTAWPGAGKPASGSETIATGDLAAGNYTVALECERLGAVIQASAEVTLLPVELTLALVPTSLIRGDDLTISWTGTEGLSCTGSGLPGTAWPGADKPATGSETVNTEPLERGDYTVELACERRGVVVEAAAVVTVLARPAELSVASGLIDMAIAGSQFVEFSVTNLSENSGFELEFSLDAPDGYEVAGVFRQAAECTVTPGESSEVRCDAGTIPEWACEVVGEGRICRLAALPSGGVAGVVIEYQGAGQATAVGRISAANAETRSSEQLIGN